MKSFVVSCILLAAVITGAAVNQHFLGETTRQLSACAAALPDSPEDTEAIRAYAEELERIWRERRLLFSLSIPASRTDRVERAIVMLSAAYEDGGGYAAAKAELLLQLACLRETELFSLTGIL